MSSIKIRTEEEIQAQLLARYKEIERESKSRELVAALDLPKVDCGTCKWRASKDGDGWSPWVCSEPLVKGFSTIRQCPIISYAYSQGWVGVPLCGPERVLYQKKRNFVFEFFISLAKRFKSSHDHF